MLRDELLRSKNDEIARCLLSRKRKLSELYFATVGYAGATDARLPDRLYHQKEQAFLDANDLSKGRFFNEATLPPLPDYASIVARAQEQWNRSRRPLDPSADLNVDLQETITATATPPGGDHVQTPVAEVIEAKAGDRSQEVIERDQAASDGGIVVVSDGDGDGGGYVVLATVPVEPVLAAPTPIAPGSPGRDVPLGDKPLPPDVGWSPGHGSSAAEPKTPQSSQDRPPSETVPSPQPPGSEGREPLPGLPPEEASPGRDSSPGQTAADGDAVQRKLDQRPSLVRGAPVPSVTEQQPLSPVSSIGPYSSNTPVPPAASPDTSPGEEETVESVLKIPRPHPLPTQDSPLSLQPDGPRPSTPSQSSTPDESSNPERDRTDGIPRRDPSLPPVVNPLEEVVIRDEVASPTAGETPSRMNVSDDPMVSPLWSSLEKDRTAVPEAEVLTESPLAPAPAPAPTEDEPTSSVPVRKSGGITIIIPSATHYTKRPLLMSPASSVVPTPPPERMTTRVSSGAIRHKSVSEILGEIPKPTVSPIDRGTAESTRATLVAGDSFLLDQISPETTARIRFKDRKEREKERSKLSTVVFPKQQTERIESTDILRPPVGDLTPSLNEEQDYLFLLFQQKAYSPPRALPLGGLLSSSHKTLTTANHLVEYQEKRDCLNLRRIHTLQSANRWPLRQMKRSVEPPRQGTHWDVLLDHMQWMQTDFREEKKWKIVAAKSCADWCAEYVNSDAAQRSLLCVPAQIPPRKLRPVDNMRDADPLLLSQSDTMDDAVPVSHPTPDLVPSTEDDSLSEGFVDDPRPVGGDSIAPAAAIFSLGSDEFHFSMDITPSAVKLLEELPLYAPLKIAAENGLPEFRVQPEADWKTEVLPVSKYVMGSIHFREDEPARKRSRYESLPGEDEREPLEFDQAGEQQLSLPPEQTNVALFRPENKHIRDRIHPGHSFRLPMEHPMPSVGFFESRYPSQWTYAEDDELRRLVKEYSYNWSLISDCLSSPSLFSSGAERRTPWECFERWIGLEGLPVDFSKTPYFRAYHQRLETAQRNLLAQQGVAPQQQQLQSPQQGNNTQPPLPVRRRTTQPIRVDRRRTSRHLAILDAMRKLAKKRESVLQKQQQGMALMLPPSCCFSSRSDFLTDLRLIVLCHVFLFLSVFVATHLASLRKANENNQPKPPISSPAGFSKLKYERETKLQEKQEQYRQQMIAQQRASLAAQRAGQPPTQQPTVNGTAVRTPNGMPTNGTGSALPNPAPNGLPNGIPVAAGANQSRSNPTRVTPNGTPVSGSLPSSTVAAMKMMPQPGMQPVMGARPGIPMQASPDNARVIREANRLQEQQRILQSRQQQQQHQSQPQPQQASPPPNVTVPNVNSSPNNTTVLAALQATGGIPNPSFHTPTSQGVSSASPRMGQLYHLSSGVIPTISSLQTQIQRGNPNMTAEQVTKLATERLHQHQQRMSQVAMSAAAGNIGAVATNFQAHDGNFAATSQSGIPNGGPGVQTSQGYSPMMRVAQVGQQNRGGVGNSPVINGATVATRASRSVTPQTQRSGSVQAGTATGANQSPRPLQVQMANS
ncbi:hypothetical protein Egran_02042 [Elaphomyces granulatus]|uniref:Vacuolar import and degradation protein 21 n=1 Tax=Elaphomyces granulatus TaxID=519963 RepID=A0A232M1F8_9EURO|nr:hypothetical protein Egran_02042 [Elaphomyces granulatus]